MSPRTRATSVRAKESKHEDMSSVGAKKCDTLSSSFRLFSGGLSARRAVARLQHKLSVILIGKTGGVSVVAGVSHTTCLSCTTCLGGA